MSANKSQALRTEYTNPAEGAAKMLDRSLQPLNWFGAAWLDCWTELGREVSEFVADRIREDVEAQHAMLHCRDMAELNTVRARFVQDAIEQYTAETGKLVTIQKSYFERLAKSA